MLYTNLKFHSPYYLAVFMEQLTTLDVHPGDKDLAANYLASLQSKLADEKAARKVAKDEI
jgi:hypothetical protein